MCLLCVVCVWSVIHCLFGLCLYLLLCVLLSVLFLVCVTHVVLSLLSHFCCVFVSVLLLLVVVVGMVVVGTGVVVCC